MVQGHAGIEGPLDTKLFVRYCIREAAGLTVMGVASFWSAGRVDWWPAWATLVVMLGWILATSIIILRVQPGLLAERLGPSKGAKPWDLAIMSILGLAQLTRYIVAGLDLRNGWTDALPFAAQLAALALCIVGYTLVVWATASNAFFSQIVRLQPERGQVVVAGGPYHLVRHPAYAGAIVFELAAPVLLASWWAMIPSALGAFLLILRTSLEDRTLRADLAGYAKYADRVRFRLLPGVW
jgi:protein-S-isoprenylcysteine O-methyltransferase Ste14